jgi:hypothetical protein
MIGITLAGIIVTRQTAVERTHVALDEHELLNSLGDALLNPLLNPLEGSTMWSCGKLGLWGRSRLPTL